MNGGFALNLMGLILFCMVSFLAGFICVFLFSGRKRKNGNGEGACGESASARCCAAVPESAVTPKEAPVGETKEEPSQPEPENAEPEKKVEEEKPRDTRVPQGTEVKPMVYRLAFHGKPTLLAEWEYRGCKCYVLSLDICPSIAVGFTKENSLTRIYKDHPEDVDAAMSAHGFSALRNCSDTILKDAGVKIQQGMDSLVGWTYDREGTDLVGTEVYDTDPGRIAKRGKRKTWTTEECMANANDVVDVVIDLIQKHENKDGQ